MRALAIPAVLIAAMVLAGCGFRPLYGTGNESGEVKAALASVALPEPDTRLAQIIRNDLVSAFHPGGKAAAERYTLVITSAAAENDSIETDSAATARRTVRVNAEYRLLARGSNAEISKGKTFSQASYDRTGRSFADFQAQTNALERAAHEISQDIRTRVAAHFASG